MRTLTRQFALGILALLAGSCARVARTVPSTRCEATAPHGAAAFDQHNVVELVGSYTLLTVTTAKGYHHYSADVLLQLAANDTLSRYYLPSLGGYRKLGDRVLAGTVQERDTGRDTVVVQGHGMSVGCTYWMCTDASPTQYRINWVSDESFGGTWENYQSGIARAVDKDGRFLPNPSGYFCAWRIGS